MWKWYTKFSESILTELTAKIFKVLKINKQAEGHILPYTVFVDIMMLYPFTLKAHVLNKQNVIDGFANERNEREGNYVLYLTSLFYLIFNNPKKL